MEETFTVKILGSGTSQGVPVIGCQCSVCKSTDPKDNRLRSSILIQWGNENFVIDSGPDFRQQLLREDIRSLRAVIYTHQHKDHIAGMDDVRAFNFLENRPMQLFCSSEVAKALRQEFSYAFGSDLYPGVPKIKINLIENTTFTLPDGPQIIPILGYHYKMPVFGYRIGTFAYFTDVKTIPEKEMVKLQDLDVLVLDCLREEPHISHLNLEMALELIDKINPKHTYLTHISHVFGKHSAIKNKLPIGVDVAFDGQIIKIKI